MSNPGGFELFVKLDTRQLREQFKQFQDMFRNAQKEMRAAMPPEARQQIREVNSMMGSGQQQVQQVNKQMGTLQHIRESMKEVSKNSLALVGIGAGIVGIFALMKEASPIFSGTFKLLQTSIMLFIRPIADFVGLVFRPIMVELLRKVILPYNEHVTPFLRDKVGPLIEYIKDPLGLKGRPIPGLGGADIGVDAMVDAIDAARDAIDTFNTAINDGREKIIRDFSTHIIGNWNDIVNFFSAAGQSIDGALQAAWNNISNFFQGVSNTVEFSLGEAWRNVVGFFNDLRLAASGTLLDAWNSVTTFFQGVSSSIESTLKPAWDGIKTVGQNIKSALESVWGAIIEAYNNIVKQIPFPEIFGLRPIPTPEEPAPQQPKSPSSSGGKSKIDVDAIEKQFGKAAGDLARQFASSRRSSSTSSSSSGSGSYKGLTGAAAKAAKAAGFAQGGTIMEPTMLFGLRSGGMGIMAEKGPEHIVPARGPAMRPIVIQGPLVHVEHVHNSADVERLASQLEARLKRLIRNVPQQDNLRYGNI